MKNRLRRIVERVILERKKPKRKPVEDSKYTKWCKEHGWERGVGEGCADDALESEDVQMRSWAIGFLMGHPETTMNENMVKRILSEQSTKDVTYKEIFKTLSKVMKIGTPYDGTLQNNKIIVTIDNITYSIDLFSGKNPGYTGDVVVTADLSRSGQRAWLFNVKGKDTNSGLNATYKRTKG